MKLIAFASVAAALVATAAANRDSCEYNCNSTCVDSEPKVRVFNRCPYTVHLWSIFKGQGCPSDQAAVIEQGGFYQENYASPQNGVGVSLKISKTDKCKPDDTVQLEYYLQEGSIYASNYLDVSYVDCPGGDCPTRQEGYYLKSGNEDGQFMANTLNEICPILSCSSADECDKCSYVNPDDRQTKSCNLQANLDFYMCGGEAPGESPSYSAAPSSAAAPSSTQQKETPTPTPSSAAEETPAYSSEAPEAPAYTEAEVAAAAVTSAPQQPNVKTEVVYVTQYEYVNAKRHAHGHRHQHFRA